MGRYNPSIPYDPESARRRVRGVMRALDRGYPESRVALNWSNPYELLVSVIMSAQTTDDNVNAVTPTLFARYPTPADLAAADPADVEDIIRSTGFFRQKTKSIIATARRLVDEHGGEVPRTMAELTKMPGAARKTANVVLSQIAPRPGSDHGIYVDTHIRRVSQRLNFTEHDDPDKIEQDLCDLLPRTRWADWPHRMILLGRGPCDARSPRCSECPIRRWCPTGTEKLGKNWRY